MRYNAAWLFQAEPSSDLAVLTAAKCSVMGLRAIYLPTTATYPVTVVRGTTQKFGEFDLKKCVTITPSFHSLLQNSPQIFREFKQPRGLL
jgi:hypothetical protein